MSEEWGLEKSLRMAHLHYIHADSATDPGLVHYHIQAAHLAIARAQELYEKGERLAEA